MSNKKTTFSSSISKTADGKYRVNYSFISPDTNERKRTSKRGFDKKKDAEAELKKLRRHIVSCKGVGERGPKVLKIVAKAQPKKDAILSIL